MSTICLNMIVRNEENTIIRCLESFKNIIDYYLIIDTGSTDNTINIMKKYFEENKLQAYIGSDQFINFEVNRNRALFLCKEISDYVMFADADMILESKTFDKSKLDKDIYHILQEDKDCSYYNIRLIKNNQQCYYKGYTHEVIVNTTENPSTEYLEPDDIKLYDFMDGGYKKDKLDRDVRLLQKHIKEEPGYIRSYFYLANTLYAQEKLEEALEMYSKRIELGGWQEEIWYCYYISGLIYFKLQCNSDAITTLLEAYNLIPDRLENIYMIYLFYADNDKIAISEIFLDIIKDKVKLKNNKHLFVDNNLYLKMNDLIKVE